MTGTQIAEVAEKGQGNAQTNIYPELRDIIKDHGLLDRQRAYYWFKMISTLLLFGIGITVLVLIDNTWILMANAAFFAFVFGQSGYVGHDAGHRAVFASKRGNEIVGLSVSSLLMMSKTWWVTVHNQHHTTPNDLELDPHTTLPPFAFSWKTALAKSRFMQVVVRYQAFYFVPILLLEGLNIRIASVRFLLKQGNSRTVWTESILMGIHFFVYFGVLFYFLTPWQVLGFFLIHQGLFGLYYGMVFAPNHKGMLILDKDNRLDFLRTQVLTTRNVKPGFIADFMYGGLNYQIEHHLFPLMPRNNLGKARKIIKPFCAKYGVPYYETGTLRSYKEILGFLKEAPRRPRDIAVVAAD
jgi:fatty acid desaturase